MPLRRSQLDIDKLCDEVAVILAAREMQLSHQHRPQMGKNLSWTPCKGMAAEEKAWDDLRELSYLEALREAIVAALASL